MIASGGSYYKIANGSIDSAGLPSEYQQVEYIESTGTQYIDTGISCNNDTRIEADIQQVSYNTNNWSVWIGSLKTTSDGNWVHLGQASRDRGLRFSWGVTNGAYIYTNISSSDFNRHTYKIDKGELTIDNTTTYTLTNSYEFTTSPSTIVLFADKKGSIVTEYSSIKIFYCKLYDNNVLIRNFIPCYRISDNEIGMYDTVNGVFYTNQGTGTFLKGPNVYNRYTIKEFDRPYISGHVTDGSSTFTFYINDNTKSKTVNVDENGWWIWYVDETITGLKNAFRKSEGSDVLDYLKINYRNNAGSIGSICYLASKIKTFECNMPITYGRSALCTNLGNEIENVTLIIDSSCEDIGYICRGCNKLISLTLKGDTSNLTKIDYIVRLAVSLKTLEIPIIPANVDINNWLGDVYTIENLKFEKIYRNLPFNNQSLLTKASVLNLINAAMANVTYTLHSTPYAKCASGGEWYTDIQAAINAKALEGYTVTLISA